jgi:hypothetical protein
VASSPLAKLKVVGLLHAAGVAKLRRLSPETSTADEMIDLARSAQLEGAGHLNLTFHSSSLLPGCTPFVSSEAQARGFLDSIDRFIEALASEEHEFVSLSGYENERNR